MELGEQIVDGLDVDEGLSQQDGGMFTPQKVSNDDSEKFNGVSIKSFPKETDHGEIVEFLINSGLDAEHREKVVIRDNGSVNIHNLENQLCRVLIEKIHSKINFGKRLYCNGIIPLTPTKDPELNSASSSLATGPSTRPPPPPVTRQ